MMTKLFLFLVSIFLYVSSFAQEATTYYQKGNAFLSKESYLEAIAMYTKAIEKNSSLGYAYWNRGVSYIKLGNYEKALLDFKKDNALTPNRQWYNLACTYALMGKIEEAINSLEKSQQSNYKINPEQLKNDTEFANIKEDIRFKKFLDLNNYSTIDQSLFLSENAMNDGDFEKASTILEKAYASQPNHKLLRERLALVYFQSGNAPKLISFLEKALAEDPNNGTYLTYKGVLLANVQQDYEMAYTYYEKAMNADINQVLYGDMMICKVKTKAYQQAIELMEKQLAISPSVGDYYWYNIALAQGALGRTESAIESLTKAIAQNKENELYYYYRGYMYFNLKNYGAAAMDLTKAIKLNDSYGEYYYLRGNARGSQLNKDGACEDWKKAKSLGYESEDLELYLNELCK